MIEKVFNLDGIADISGTIIKKIRGNPVISISSAMIVGMIVGVGAIKVYAGITTGTPPVAGVLPPPTLTPADPSIVSGSSCDCDCQNAKLIAASNAQKKAALSALSSGAAQSPAALSSCLNGMANISIPGLMSFNVAGLIAAAESAACSAVTSEVQSLAAPAYQGVAQLTQYPSQLVQTLSNNVGGGNAVLSSGLNQSISGGLQPGQGSTVNANTVVNSATSLFSSPAAK